MEPRELVSDDGDVIPSDNRLEVRSSKALSIEILISQAITSQVPVETMERLLAMAEKLEAKYAKEAFDSAMAAFQAACPIIRKTKAGYNYMYAPIESIVAQVKALLQEHGFSYAVQTETNTDQKQVTATCIAKHSQGHSESSSFTVPMDMRDNKSMSDTQKVAAALTFAKRYAFCNAFGILTGDEDTDSKVEVAILITIAQLAQIRQLLSQTTYKEEGVCTAYKVERLEDLTSAQAYAIILRLEKHIASS